MKYNVDVKSPKKRQLSLNINNARNCIKQVSNTISYLIPNYYWETINDRSTSFTITYNNDSNSYIGYGHMNPRYFLTSSSDYSQFTQRKISNFINNVITYVDNEDDIEAIPVMFEEGDINNGEFELNVSEYIHFADERNHYQETVVGYFLDMISDSEDISGTYSYNARVFRITIDDTYKPAWDSYIPLLFRIEREGKRVGGTATTISSKIIDINYTPINPIILAYDGPDPNRTLSDGDSRYFNTKTGRYISSSAASSTPSEYLSLSALHTSPPVYLNTNADFKGILYAPFSRVYINGPGKIDGCVVAGDIVDNSNINRTIYNMNIDIPQLASSFQGSNAVRYNYTTSIRNVNIKIVTDEFNMFGLHNLYKDNFYLIGQDPDPANSI